MNKWFDSRITKPSPKATNRYPVVVLYCGMIMHGIARYMPNCNYTDGNWIDIESTNGNSWSDAQVLYWTEFPKFDWKIENE